MSLRVITYVMKSQVSYTCRREDRTIDTYLVIWLLRLAKQPSRYTKHVYAGLTLEQAKRQARVCNDNSVDALEEGYEVRVEVLKEE